MEPQTIEYFAQIELEKNPKMVGNPGLLSVTSFGRKLGFASSYLQSRGFFSDGTMVGGNADNGPWPILTWPFLDFLAGLDLSDTRLVELGAGGSTLALAALFNRVVSFENSASFVEKLTGVLPANATVTLFHGDTLDVGAVDMTPADWLLVDFSGKRTRFIKDMIAEKPSSRLPVAVILDNSDWYRNAGQLLASAGYSEVPFFGLKSGQTWVSCTSFFFLPDRLRLRFKTPFHQPPFSRTLAAQWDSLD